LAKWNARDPACYTKSLSTTLTIDASGADMIRFAQVGPAADCANIASIPWGFWEAISATKPVTLPANDGQKKICIQRKASCRPDDSEDSVGCGAMIILDTTQPQCINLTPAPNPVRWSSEVVGTFTFNGSLSDNENLASISLSCYGSDNIWHPFGSISATNVDEKNMYFINWTSVLPAICQTRLSSSSTNIAASAIDRAGNISDDPVNKNCHAPINWVSAENPSCANPTIIADVNGVNTNISGWTDVYDGLNLTYNSGTITGSGWLSNIRQSYVTAGGTQNVIDCTTDGAASCNKTVNISSGTTLAYWTHVKKTFPDQNYACLAKPASSWSPGVPNNNPATSCTNSCVSNNRGVCYQQYDYEETRQDTINTYCNAQSVVTCPDSTYTWKNPMTCHIGKTQSGTPTTWGMGHFDMASKRCVADSCTCVCSPQIPITGLSSQCLADDQIFLSWNGATGAEKYNVRINQDPLSTWAGCPAAGCDPNDASVLSNTNSMTRTITPNTLYGWSVQAVKPGEVYPYSSPPNPADITTTTYTFSCGSCPLPGAPVINSPVSSCSATQPSNYQITQTTSGYASCFPWDGLGEIRNSANSVIFNSPKTANVGAITAAGDNHTFSTWYQGGTPIAGLPVLGTGDYSFRTLNYKTDGTAGTAGSVSFGVDKTAPTVPQNFVSTDPAACLTWSYNASTDSGCGLLANYEVDCSDNTGKVLCAASVTTTNFSLNSAYCTGGAPVEESTVTCTVKAVDGVGNKSANATANCVVPKVITCETGPPAKTTVISPKGTESNPIIITDPSVIFRWNASTDSLTDKYTVGAWDNTGNQVVGDDLFLGTNSLTEGSNIFEPGVKYHWQIQTKNTCVGEETLGWSLPPDGVGWFMIPAPTPTPLACSIGVPTNTTLVSPLGGPTSPVLITDQVIDFNWAKSADPKTDGYIIGTWNQSDGEQIIRTVGGGDTTSLSVPTTNYNIGTTYHWQIQTYNNCSVGTTEKSAFSAMAGYFMIPPATVDPNTEYLFGRVWWDKNGDFERRDVSEPMLTDTGVNNFVNISVSHTCGGITETMGSSRYNSCTVNDGIGPFRSSGLNKSWLTDSCTLTATIDQNSSPGWFFPVYNMAVVGKGDSGVDFRLENRDMDDKPPKVYADACLTTWNNPAGHIRGTCLTWNTQGKCIENRITVTGMASDAALSFKALIPVNVANLPFFDSLAIKNSEGVVVSPTTNGTDNQICEDAFRESDEPRRVKFEATVGHYGGFADISKVTMRYNNTDYPMSYKVGSGAGTMAVWETDQTFDIGSAIDLKPISVIVEDKVFQSSGWQEAGRNFEVWNCEVDIRGTLFDGSDAPLGQLVCTNRPVGYNQNYAGNYGLSFDVNSTTVSMTVSTPTYTSGGSPLTWGESYIPTFTGVSGSEPKMCVGINSISSINTETLVDPYNPAEIVADFSSIVNQSSWYQVEGGNIRAGIRITNKIPPTCYTGDTCSAAMCTSNSTLKLDNGIVEAPSITNNGGCSLGTCSYGEPNNWYWSGNLTNKSYGYSYWSDKLSSKIPDLTTIGSGTSWSLITSTFGSGGIGLINGDLTINGDNSLPVGKTLMLVVSGKVEVTGNVTNWEGIVVADGDIEVNGVNSTQLVLSGVFYSAQESVVINRTYNTDPVTGDPAANNESPAVVIRFKPSLVLNLPASLTKIISGFTNN